MAVDFATTPETPLSWVLVSLPSRVRDLAHAGTSQVQPPFLVALLTLLTIITLIVVILQY